MSRNPAHIVDGIPSVIPCAHMGCDRRAIVRVKVGSGWANLCYPDYLAHHAKIAEEKVEARGLQFFPDSETPAEWRARVIAFMKSKPMVRPMPDAAPRAGARVGEEAAA